MAFIYDSCVIIDIVKAALTLPRVEKLSWNKKERISTRSIPLDYEGEDQTVNKEVETIFPRTNHVYMQPNETQLNSTEWMKSHHVNTWGN